jgi:hypothetical protein
MRRDCRDDTGHGRGPAPPRRQARRPTCQSTASSMTQRLLDRALPWQERKLAHSRYRDVAAADARQRFTVLAADAPAVLRCVGTPRHCVDVWPLGNGPVLGRGAFGGRLLCTRRQGSQLHFHGRGHLRVLEPIPRNSRHPHIESVSGPILPMCLVVLWGLAPKQLVIVPIRASLWLVRSDQIFIPIAAERLSFQLGVSGGATSEGRFGSSALSSSVANPASSRHLGTRISRTRGGLSWRALALMMPQGEACDLRTLTKYRCHDGRQRRCF